MRIALVLALALPLLLQGCLPIPARYVDNDYFHIPASTAPLASYTNGMDLYRYFVCYRPLDGPSESCHTAYIVMERGAKPDWQPIARSHEGEGAMGHDSGLLNLTPVLSAYSGTSRRVIGLDRQDDGRPSIRLIEHDARKNASLPLAERRGELDIVDVWRNGPRCPNLGRDTHPRLIVEDDTSTWIFADLEPGCKENPADRRAPVDMMDFDHPERFADLLHRPMYLFYQNRAKPEDADFHDPRFATSHAPRLKNLPRVVIAIDSVPVPKGKVFTLEYNEFHEPLDALPHSNLHCRYSETRLYDSIFRAQPSPSFDWCRPIRK